MSARKIQLQDLLDRLDSYGMEKEMNPEITHVTYDSRKSRKGSLFVAIIGTRFDGNEYVEEAIQRGACAIITERRISVPSHVARILVPNARRALADVAARFFGDPVSSLKVVGVTGTNGKTSVCYFLQAILKSAGWKTARFGTLGHDMGPRQLPARMTTPESLELHAMFDELRSTGYDSVVMEVSSHALEQDRVKGIPFRAAVFTNLSQDHLDYHSDMDDYLQSKKKLFQGLDRDGIGVINLDDSRSVDIVEGLTCRLMRYGLFSKAECTVRDLNSSIGGSQFTWIAPGVQAGTRLFVGGDFSVSNFLASAATALGLGIGVEYIVRGAARVQGIPGRVEVIPSPRGTILVDYAHTPGALEALLSWAARHTEGRLVVLFGAGGDRDRTKRCLMGEVASRFADRIILTSDNPRSEDPRDIVDDILSGVSPEKRNQVDILIERRDAIQHGIEILEEKDTLILAGKGHERVQVFHRQEVPFDDRETVKEFLGYVG